MEKVKSLLNKMSSPRNVVGDLLLIKSFVSKVFSLFITTQSAEDSRQRRSGMTALLDVKAFTLVELLVVVLIIGILSAVAIPMYQGAVDKSHWSTMLPASKAIKDAEEAFKMTNGEYSDTMEHLDVQMNNSDLTFTLNTPNNLADPNVIRVTNSKLGNNVRLASYLDDSPMFAGQLHCEAKNEGSTPNERGQRLCEKLLGGQELTSADGYTGYLLDQAIDKATCKDAHRSWSSSQTKCYTTTSERCTASGATYTGAGCFYQADNVTLEEGDVCDANFPNWYPPHPCKDSIFNSGSVCKSGGNSTCQGGTWDNAKAENCALNSCTGTFSNGSSCEGKGTHSCIGTFTSGSQCNGIEDYACRGTFTGTGTICTGNNTRTCLGTYTDGAICVANEGYSCMASYENGGICIGNIGGSCDSNSAYSGTGCCCGKYCKADKKCDDSVCASPDIAMHIKTE